MMSIVNAKSMHVLDKDTGKILKKIILNTNMKDDDGENMCCSYFDAASKDMIFSVFTSNSLFEEYII